MHRSGKGAAGHKSVDRGATQPGCLDDSGQARQDARHVGFAIGGCGGELHGDRPRAALEKSRVPTARHGTGDDFRCPIVALARLCTAKGLARANQVLDSSGNPAASHSARHFDLRWPQGSLQSSSQLPASSGVRTAPSSKRQVEKRLLGFRQHDSIVLLIEPALRLRAVRFDLPRQLVADRP
jgi:hypothetical protein